MSTHIDDDDDDFEHPFVTLITEGEVARELLNAAQATQEEIDAVDYERPSGRELHPRSHDES